ncbi:MAG: hypothetical protein NZ534_12930 [Bacteroidia bacterium]|nr:hypothetical protein [Bacteroidia bacterium]
MERFALADADPVKMEALRRFSLYDLLLYAENRRKFAESGSKALSHFQKTDFLRGQ